MDHEVDDHPKTGKPLRYFEDAAFLDWLHALAAHNPGFVDAEQTIRVWLAAGTTLAAARRRAKRRKDAIGVALNIIILELARREATTLIEDEKRFRETYSPLEYLRHRIGAAKTWRRLPLALRFCLNCGTKIGPNRDKFCSDKCGNAARSRRRTPR
jgi:uncharacterized protein with Zn-ribbon domain DUF2116